MPTKDEGKAKTRVGEQITKRGLFLGYHTQPGELWSGDYLVLEWESIRCQPDAPPSKCRISRVGELFNVQADEKVFPLAVYREKEELRVIAPDSAKGATGDGEPSQLDEVPDPAGTPEPRSTDAPGAPIDEDTEEGTARAVPDSPEAPIFPSEDPLAWAVTVPDGQERRDTRGEGEVTGIGRKVRKYKGSKRPPGIDPEVWSSPTLFTR